MPIQCEEGWDLESMPSTPSDTFQADPPKAGYLGTYIEFKKGTHEWVFAEDGQWKQCPCNKLCNFTYNITFEGGASVQVGAVLVEGSLSYSIGSGTGIEITVGPDPTHEFIGRPIVLQYVVVKGWYYNKRGTLRALWDFARGGPLALWVPDLHITDTEAPMYTRASWMICRRRCPQSATQTSPRAAGQDSSGE